MPKKFTRCVKDVKRSQRLHPKYKRVNPYAVCRVSTGFYGSTHHSKLHSSMHKDKVWMKTLAKLNVRARKIYGKNLEELTVKQRHKIIKSL